MFRVFAGSLAIVAAAVAGKSYAESGANSADCKGGEQVSIDQEESGGSIIDVARSAGQFKTLAAAIEAAGFTESLETDGPYTVFAPTDEAFAKLGKETLADLLKPENRHQLRSILRYHVVKGNVKAVDAVKAGKAKTRQGGEVRFEIRDGRLVVNNSQVLKTDIAADNGVIHVIDTVLLPS